jgi:hypothetical protein
VGCEFFGGRADAVCGIFFSPYTAAIVEWVCSIFRFVEGTIYINFHRNSPYLGKWLPVNKSHTSLHGMAVKILLYDLFQAGAEGGKYIRLNYPLVN